MTIADPIGRIDLGSCVTQEVSIAPREICSRMHTFMLETSRAASRSDKDSLVVQTQGNISVMCLYLSDCIKQTTGEIAELFPMHAIFRLLKKAHHYFERI